jgi:hypothetical protein
MNIDNYLLKLATTREIEKDRYSCLKIALDDARIITGRNENGLFIENNVLENGKSFLNQHSFIGLVNYLLVLDLIGEVFILKPLRLKELKLEKIKSDKMNIYKALKQFSSLIDKDIYTINALRNSLAHNYGLINIPDESKYYESSLHKFNLLNLENSALIKYPETKWETVKSDNNDKKSPTKVNFKDKDEKSSTKVSPIKLQDLVEEVYQNLINELTNNNVELSISGIDELNARFTIIYDS